MLEGLLEEMPWGKAEDVKTIEGIVSSGPSLLVGLTNVPKGVREDVETNFNVGFEPLIAASQTPSARNFLLKIYLEPRNIRQKNCSAKPRLWLSVRTFRRQSVNLRVRSFNRVNFCVWMGNYTASQG